MNRIICGNCKFWKIEDEKMLIGLCIKFNKRIEYTAGVRLHTPKKTIFCPAFIKNENQIN